MRQATGTKRSAGVPPATYPAGRRCECGTVLSIYNADNECASCASLRPADKVTKVKNFVKRRKP